MKRYKWERKRGYSTEQEEQEMLDWQQRYEKKGLLQPSEDYDKFQHPRGHRRERHQEQEEEEEPSRDERFQHPRRRRREFKE